MEGDGIRNGGWGNGSINDDHVNEHARDYADEYEHEYEHEFGRGDEQHHHHQQQQGDTVANQNATRVAYPRSSSLTAGQVLALVADEDFASVMSEESFARQAERSRGDHANDSNQGVASTPDGSRSVGGDQPSWSTNQMTQQPDEREHHPVANARSTTNHGATHGQTSSARFEPQRRTSSLTAGQILALVGDEDLAALVSDDDDGDDDAEEAGGAIPSPQEHLQVHVNRQDASVDDGEAGSGGDPCDEESTDHGSQTRVNKKEKEPEDIDADMSIKDHTLADENEDSRTHPHIQKMQPSKKHPTDPRKMILDDPKPIKATDEPKKVAFLGAGDNKSKTQDPQDGPEIDDFLHHSILRDSNTTDLPSTTLGDSAMSPSVVSALSSHAEAIHHDNQAAQDAGSETDAQDETSVPQTASVGAFRVSSSFQPPENDDVETLSTQSARLQQANDPAVVAELAPTRDEMRDEFREELEREMEDRLDREIQERMTTNIVLAESVRPVEPNHHEDGDGDGDGDDDPDGDGEMRVRKTDDDSGKWKTLGQKGRWMAFGVVLICLIIVAVVIGVIVGGSDGGNDGGSDGGSDSGASTSASDGPSTASPTAQVGTSFPTLTPSSFPTTPFPSAIPTPMPTQTDDFFMMRDRLHPLLEDPPASLNLSVFDDPDSIPYRVLDWMANDDPESKAIMANEADMDMDVDVDMNMDVNANEYLLDRYIMASMYYSWDGPNWPDQMGFLSNTTICSWKGPENRGVTCNDDGFVDRIYFEKSGLSGPFPDEFFQIRRWTYIILRNDAITGTIPSSISPSLVQLDLALQQLTGSIPTEVGLLTYMQHFSVLENSLNGTIPTEFGNCTSLILLQMFRNYLSGQIPSELGSLPAIDTLQVYNNTLTGTVPTELGQLSTLRIFEFPENYIIGDIDPIFCSASRNLPPLQHLAADCLGSKRDGSQLSRVVCSCCSICCDPVAFTCIQSPSLQIPGCSFGGCVSCELGAVARSCDKCPFQTEDGGFIDFDDLIGVTHNLTQMCNFKCMYNTTTDTCEQRTLFGLDV